MQQTMQYKNSNHNILAGMMVSALPSASEPAPAL
jgi:hypothetical protein